LGDRIGDDISPISSDWRRVDTAVKSIRDVDIGWDGPPDTTGIKPTLPDDWNAEFDYGSQLEHGSATRVSVPVNRSRNAVAVDGGVNTIVAANDVEIVDQPPSSQASEEPDHFTSELEAMVDGLEQTLADSFSIFEIDVPAANSKPLLTDGNIEEQLIARLNLLLSRQMTFNAALESLVGQASQTLEPRMIEARVDAASRKLPWPGNRGYWQAYRAQFEKDGKSLSIRDVFSEAMRASIDNREEQASASMTKRTNNS
jgi:type VI secretion system protein ImpI